MSLIQHRIYFYHNLSVMLDAGLSLDHALRQPYTGPFHKAADNLRRDIQAGALFHEAMQSSRLFSEFECNIIAVGESSGRLPESLGALDRWFTQKLALRRKILRGLALPVFLYIFAGLILTGTDYLLKKLCPVQVAMQLVRLFLIPFVLLLFFKILLAFSRKNALPGYLLEPIPILGSLQHKLETCRFFLAMGIGLSAGISMTRSIHIAAHCCCNRFYIGRYLKMIPMIQEEKETFASAFHRIQNRRDTYSPIPALISTGEISGKLDVFCTRIGNLLYDEASQLLSRIAGFIPKFFYLIILAFIAWKIISLFGAYIQQVNSLL